MTHRLIIASAGLSESKLPGRIDDALGGLMMQDAAREREECKRQERIATSGEKNQEACGSGVR